jgi:uncharacterized RDD family membrane protein YckC
VLTTRSGSCRFCDTSVSTEISLDEAAESASRPRGNPAVLDAGVSADPAWRGELARRLAVYRTRRRKSAANTAQPRLPFERAEDPRAPGAGVAVAENPAAEPAADAFAFTMAIGRAAPFARDPREESRMEIDVSLPLAPPASESFAAASAAPEEPREEFRLFPVASLGERRIAAFLDAGCLLFAYGGFLTLFGSLGGEFTLSKLSAAVYIATVALFYLQYFALFTVFGGATPGMMLRGLQVVGFSGEPPTPRQLLARSAGYILSAGSFFLGFLWAYWDEDQLTWHDRISRTYLTAPQRLPHAEAQGARTH